MSLPARFNTLMVQGTTSDAGKSVLVAGLCRVLARRGSKVAPFKPQNMALNSAVTVNGGEIGRAQAVQAQACGLEAHTDMNPVLLKPSSDTGAQVIVHGQAMSNMEAQAFHDYKKVAMEAVLQSHRRLLQQYEVVVVEGAGSPAEINLREGDIANMGFAEAVNCPVIIVADIDRGGVFAHLVGTLALLSESERQRVAGFVINRFRGDIALLQPGLDWLEQQTGKPVLGVLPYMKDFYLDAEDAINTQQTLAANEPLLNVTVPVLPRISNHTDFDALRHHSGVNLQMVPLEGTMPPTDLLVLPGSKNVRADLSALRAAGWEEKIRRHLRYGGKLLGICGGFQMLGRVIHDPVGIEDCAGSCEGLAYLDMETTLDSEKQLQWTEGKLWLDDVTVRGYEIHCGISTMTESTGQPFVRLAAGSDGWVSQDGCVAGTYLHGLFDVTAVADRLLHWAGLVGRQAVDIATLREKQLERLADCLEAHLDPEFLQALQYGGQC